MTLIIESRQPDELWETCQRGDRMLWLASRAGVPRHLVTLAACDCARLALQHVPDGEDRPRLCIETTEAYTRGEATIQQQVDAANYAADSASVRIALADCRFSESAVEAACAAYCAAQSAYSAYHAAGSAASAAASLARAGSDVILGAVHTETLAECANIVRARISWSMVESALKLKGMEI